MGKLADKLKGLFQKFKDLTIGKKIAYSVLVFGVLITILVLTMYSTRTKYGVLFSNMDTTDSKTVLDKLSSMKVNSKVQGNSILVPESQVDNLRLQLASSLTDGSKGFELFDNSSQFGGMTDEQMTITYQRALEGELERTLKGFPEVEGARVHLVMSEDSAFVKDTNPSTASVTLKLKSGNTLSNDQVKAIVALMCGSVKDLKKENVQIVDDKMKLLTSDDSSGNDTSSSVEATQNQQQLKSNYEKTLEQKITDIVKPVTSSGNVKVKVNADMDFNSQQVDSVVKESGPVVSSSVTDDSSVNGGTNSTASSTVDNNTNSTTYPAGTTTGNSSSTHKQTTTNYENGQTETKTIVAPGKILRLTASVMIDGNLSDAEKDTLTKSISSAIGVDSSRNDVVTVASMKFNTKDSDSVKNDIASLNAANRKKLQKKLLQELGIALGAVIVLGVIALSMKKRKDKANTPIEGLEEGGLNVLIGEDVLPKEPKQEIEFEPIDFEVQNEDTHVENEIRNYAKNKPDQVTDIIKAWLADEER